MFTMRKDYPYNKMTVNRDRLRIYTQMKKPAGLKQKVAELLRLIERGEIVSEVYIDGE